MPKNSKVAVEGTEKPGPVAVITGANQGIGYATAMAVGLSKKYTHVVLGCMEDDKGIKARQDLQEEMSAASPDVIFHYVHLKIGNVRSHKAFVKTLIKMFGTQKIKLLVNNAAMCYRVRDYDDPPKATQCKNIMDCNFNGTIDFTQRMLPLIRLKEPKKIPRRLLPKLPNLKKKNEFAGEVEDSDEEEEEEEEEDDEDDEDNDDDDDDEEELDPANFGRIVFVTSILGRVAMIKSKESKGLLSDEEISLDDLKKIFKDYVQDIDKGRLKKKGWTDNYYAMSKLGLNLYMRILARDEYEHGVISNSVCPGYCRTAMTGWEGPRTARQGAVSVIEPALMDKPPNGLFFSPDTDNRQFVFELKKMEYS